MGATKGLIWYENGYYCGSEEEYRAHIRNHGTGKLVYTFEEITYTQLKKLCDGLNELSIRRVQEKTDT